VQALLYVFFQGLILSTIVWGISFIFRKIRKKRFLKELSANKKDPVVPDAYLGMKVFHTEFGEGTISDFLVDKSIACVYFSKNKIQYDVDPNSANNAFRIGVLSVIEKDKKGIYHLANIAK
jgi:hypothetical protein